MRPSKLTPEEVRQEMATIPSWSLQGDEIRRQYKFPDFVRSIAFVVRLADRAEALNHHPDIDIRYDKVTLALSTHDAGGLTVNDFTLARQSDQLESAPSETV